MSRNRAPEGVVKHKPIALRLLPAELEQLKALAASEMRPMSNMVRLIVLRALAQVEQGKAS